jgi:hypothetical protein
MAKKATSKVDRSAKLAEIREIAAELEDRIQGFDKAREQRELLDSVAEGLYEETDKLCKKAPGEQVTELLLDQVNQVIQETKDLITKDPYVRRMNQFVAAGDRPEHRDVVVILRMVRQALTRFVTYLEEAKPEMEGRLREARVIEFAVEQYQANGVVLKLSGINEEFVKGWDVWFVGDDEHFDFEDLDERPLKEYFELG